MTPTWPLLIQFCILLVRTFRRPSPWKKLKFLALTVCEILGNPEISKLGHVTATWPLLNQFCIFSLELTAVRLRVKFEVSSFNGYGYIRLIPKFQNWVTWHLRDPFWPNFAFLWLELTAIRLHAKFEVFSFNQLRDIRESQNSKIGSRDPHMTFFDPILHFFVRSHCR